MSNAKSSTIATAPATSRAKKLARETSQQARWNLSSLSKEEIHSIKRTALIRKAGNVFKEKGFHNTSLDDVAKALNVSKPALYYYVNGKQELLFHCHMMALDLGDESIKVGMVGDTGLEKLCNVLANYIELTTDSFSAYSVLSDIHDLLPEHQSIIYKRRKEFTNLYRSLVEEGIRDGSIAPCDPKIAVTWFMGALTAIPRWYKEKGTYNGAQVAAMYANLFAKGLAADPTKVPKATA